MDQQSRSHDPASATDASSEVFGGFSWKSTDTLSVLMIAVALVVAYYPLAVFGKIPLDRDNIAFFYPMLSCFKEPGGWFWNPFQQAGCSLIANPQAALHYPPNWIFFVLPLRLGYIISTLGHYYLAGIGVYLLARFCRLRTLSALVAAFVYCLGGYLAARLLLRPLLLSAAWFPLLFLCYLFGHHRRQTIGYLLAGVCLGMQVLAGMPHNAVYSAMAFGFFTLYRLVWQVFYRRDFRLWGKQLLGYFLFLAVGFLMAAAVILPTMELIPHTVRSQFTYEEATTNSLPLNWIPDVFIGGTYHQAPVDWHFLETNCYIGVVALWLVIFALLGNWQKGVFWFFTGLVALSILFAFGNNTFIYRLFYHFPYLDVFGVPTIGRFFDIPSRFLGLTAFALAMLAGYGVDSLSRVALRSPGQRLNKAGRLIVLALSVGCICWLVLLIMMAIRLQGDLLNIFLDPTSRSTYYVQANFAFFTLVFGLFTITFLLGRLRSRTFQLLLLVVLVADLLHSGTQIKVDFAEPEDIYRRPVAVRYLQQKTDPNRRVMGMDALKTIGGDVKYVQYRSILTPKLAMIYKLQDVSGYDPLILDRYSKAVQRLAGQAPGETPLRVVAWAGADHPLTDLLRVGHISGEVYEQRIFGGQIMEIHSGERRVLKVEMDRECEEVRLHSAMSRGFTIPQDTEVGRLTLIDATGERAVFPLRAGVETADLHVEVAHFHHPADKFRTWNQVLLFDDKRIKLRVSNYVCRLALEKPMKPVAVEIENTSEANLAVMGIGLKHTPTSRFERVYNSKRDRIYRNRTVLPRAWWVHRVEIEPSADRLLDRMDSGLLHSGARIDYRQIALLEEEPSILPSPSLMPEGGEIEILQWKPGELELDVNSDASGLVVLSEIHYPGWKAEIDGEPTEILRANYLLRALAVPEGQHRIRMIYRPLSYYFGLIASILTALLIVRLFWRFRRTYPERTYRDPL